MKPRTILFQLNFEKRQFAMAILIRVFHGYATIDLVCSAILVWDCHSLLKCRLFIVLVDIR